MEIFRDVTLKWNDKPYHIKKEDRLYIIALIEDRLDWYFRHMRKRRREQFAKQWEKKVKRPFDAVLEAKLIAAKHLDDDTDCDCFHCISNNNDSK